MLDLEPIGLVHGLRQAHCERTMGLLAGHDPLAQHPMDRPQMNDLFEGLSKNEGRMDAARGLHAMLNDFGSIAAARLMDRLKHTDISPFHSIGLHRPIWLVLSDHWVDGHEIRIDIVCSKDAYEFFLFDRMADSLRDDVKLNHASFCNAHGLRECVFGNSISRFNRSFEMGNNPMATEERVIRLAQAVIMELLRPSDAAQQAGQAVPNIW